MKYIKNLIISFLLVTFFMANNAGSAIVKIYKLKNINIESEEKNYNGGLLFYKQETNEIISFTLDKDYTENNGVEITTNEYLDYVESLKLTKKKIELTSEQKRNIANNILASLQNKVFLYFLDEEVKSADDVRKIAKKKINELLSDKLDNNELNLIMLLLAYSGKVQFNQTGIQGISTQLEADNYLTNFYNNTIKKINNIKNQARQFMQDNNLN